MREVAVIGAGTMGAGIAQVFARAGDVVRLIERDPAQLGRGLAKIERNLRRMEEQGDLPANERAAALGRVHGSGEVRDAGLAPLVVEAIYEDLGAKLEVLRALDEVCPPDTILASNTSSISITALGAGTARPDRVVGMHWFNPAPAMRLIEVVRGLGTSEETVDRVCAEARRLGKEPVEVRDFPGFVSNRVLLPMINEAAWALYEGVAGRDEIDRVMTLGMNHPLGPLALADLIGLDVCVHILDTLRDGFGDPKYRACPLLRQFVAGGRLGRKTGRGFYEYGA